MSVWFKTPNWWYGIWASSGYTYTWFAYYMGLSAIGIYLIYDYGHNARTAREKMQSKLQLVTSIITLGLASIVNVILPLAGLNVLPQIADIIIVIWEIGIIFSVIKYGLMTITPEIASDQILSTMTDSLMLLDTQGIIKLANRASEELLGARDVELNGANYSSLVVEKEAAKLLLEDTFKNGTSVNRELTYLSRDDRMIPSRYRPPVF